MHRDSPRWRINVPGARNPSINIGRLYSADGISGACRANGSCGSRLPLWRSHYRYWVSTDTE